MHIKQSLKPNILKISIFLFIGIVYLYFAKESVCAASLFFAFCYNAYGFPFSYLASGNVDAAAGHIKTLSLGGYFSKHGSVLFNPFALFLNLVLIYLLSCFIAYLLKNTKLSIKS
ncbi:hypothetical protein J4234_04720 [Candidatus Woesearchaeota archaeon]|nr:hypothetical protein [Candidatus Woesearchaeota archaeon]